jgi:phenylalanyl-tRNA synthetase beta subunit
MPAKRTARKTASLAALCACERDCFPVALSNITPDGCAAEAECDWDTLREFLHLRIADTVEINGRVIAHDGRRAQIGFFGQIHPAVIAGWSRRVA